MGHKSQMETLDNLLESIAFENFTTNIHMAGWTNGDQGVLTYNNNINQKTDTLNRYFDNLINFNRECESNTTRKSTSPSSSDRSDHQNNNGRMPQVKQQSFHIFFHCQCHHRPCFYLELFSRRL